jgi:hypothetical protein
MNIRRSCRFLVLPDPCGSRARTFVRRARISGCRV